jgi:GNAT superfamily N-acetyltransferase
VEKMTDGQTDVPAGKIANVMTFLEMSAMPQLRPDRIARPLTLTRWQRPDLDEYRALFHRVGDPYLWFARLELGDDELAGILNDPNDEIYIARDEKDVAGWFELDFRKAHECELRYFGLVPEAVGTGAGRWLMNRVLERAWARPVRRFWLKTCTLDHPGALDFYRRSGLTPFQRAIEIADDPRLRGLVPRDAAPGVPLL